MYCYRCGQRLVDTAKHCPNCGAAIFYTENGPAGGAKGTDGGAFADGNSSYRTETHYSYDPETGSYRYNTDDQGGSGYSGTNYTYAGQGTGGQPAYGAYQPAYTKQDGFALASLICAIASLCCCCVSYVGLPLGIAAVVLGILGLKAAQRRTLALVGLVLGAIMLLLNAASLGLTVYYAAHPEFMQDWLNQMQEILGESWEFPVQ